MNRGPFPDRKTIRLSVLRACIGLEITDTQVFKKESKCFQIILKAIWRQAQSGNGNGRVHKLPLVFISISLLFFAGLCFGNFQLERNLKTLRKWRNFFQFR